MRFSPNTSLAMVCAGILAIYAELLRPGRILPGTVGILLLAAGGYSLWLNAPSTSGIVLICLSLVFFGLEWLFPARFVAGAIATLLLFSSFRLSFKGSAYVSLPVAGALSLAIGAVTAVLTRSARIARRNKRLT